MTPELKTAVLTTDDLELFRVAKNRKIPAVKGGFYAARKNFDIVRAFINGYNVGFKQFPSFITIDMDEDEEKGYHGIEVISNLEKELGVLPRTYTQRTPRGGLHKVFLTDGINKKVKGKITPAVDLKTNGFILFQGSQINGKHYQAIDCFNPNTGKLFFSALPSSWINFIESSTQQSNAYEKYKSDYEPEVIEGDFKKAYDNCLFIQKCVNESSELPEQEWHLFARLLNIFSNGEELFLKYSKNYPGFNLETTKKKFAYARKYPINCRVISDVSDACKNCKNTIVKERKMSVNSKNTDIKLVSTPVTFAKKGFAEWFESIKSEIPRYTQFGTNWRIELPKNVAEPDIKKSILFYENCTYCCCQTYVGKNKKPVVTIKKLINGIPYKVDLQLLISNNRTEEKPVATICLVFKLDNGKISKPILLDSRAKTRHYDFVLAVNKSNNRLQCNLDDESFILLKEKINQQKTNTTLVFKNAGSVKYKNFDGRLYQNCYVDSKGIITPDEDDLIMVNQQSIKLDDSYKDKLPNLYLGEVDIKELLQNFLKQAEQVYKNRLDIFLVLGASIMTIFIDDIWQKYPGFPIIYLYGATKQGKSILQGIISNFFGYSNKNVSMGNSTDNAIAMKCHRVNAIPVLINDFDYYKSQGVAFENNVVQFYEGGVREKMYDGSVMNRMPINTTAIFSSNYLPNDKPKIFNRLLPIYFPENGIDTKFINDIFVNDERRSLIIAELLKIPKEYILNKIKEIENWLLQSKFFKNKDRESNNVAIAFTGLILIEKLSGYVFVEKEIKLKEYCEWYENLFSNENTPIEHFLNALPGLASKSKIKKRIHYRTEIKDNKFLFTFDFAECIAIYNKSAFENDIPYYIDKRMFGEDLRNSKYFVSKGNNRFNNTKGQAYSYTLDLTSHNIASCITLWGQSSYEIQEEIA